MLAHAAAGPSIALRSIVSSPWPRRAERKFFLVSLLHFNVVHARSLRAFFWFFAADQASGSCSTEFMMRLSAGSSLATHARVASSKQSMNNWPAALNVS